MAIVRLALTNPSANTNTLLHTATRNSLVSVIATNKSTSNNSLITIWVQPTGSTLESQYAYISYDVNLPFSNTIETFRFALEDGDAVYVKSSTADVSFSINAIYESTGTSNITVSGTAPSSPTVGDVWVNTSNSTVYFWSNTGWESAAPATAYYQSSAPSIPGVGDIWVDSDEALIIQNSNEIMLKSGGTFTGQVNTVYPISSNNVANKQYVDELRADVNIPMLFIGT